MFRIMAGLCLVALLSGGCLGGAPAEVAGPEVRGKPGAAADQKVKPVPPTDGPCREPYPAIRWLAQYCMAKNSTDDLESASVQGCMSQAAEAKGNDCEQAVHWKGLWCIGHVKRLLHPKGMTVENCVSDVNVAPEGVKNGF